MLGNLSQVWIEIIMLPFLFVFSVFLSSRLATSSEINRRFLLLVLSTFATAACEVYVELVGDIYSISLHNKIFYSLIISNAYCLFAYVAAYTHSNSVSLMGGNFFVLCVTLILLFMAQHILFAPAIAVGFVIEAFVLQLLFQQHYTNGQFIVMNALFMLLIDSFILQYLFGQNIPLVYSVATWMLAFTFFYLEAPTYRQLISAHHQIDKARIRAEASIQQANIANRAKSNFLASTSHEIRTPMNAILGINDMIIAENNDPETENAALAVKTAGEYLLSLVNNILDISKIEAGKMELYEADYHLWDLLKDCEQDMTALLKNKQNVKFVIKLDNNIPEYLYGDALRLKQVIINLLHNAVKYTDSGAITLSINGERKSYSELALSFSVKDTGLGIQEKDLQHIFEPFERANILETRHIMGAGLGLTLVKNILDIMNGNISVKSVYTEGTEFLVSIPQKVSLANTMTIGQYEEFMSAQHFDVQADSVAAKSVWPEAKILVVDDTPVNLVVAKGMLKSCEAEIFTAESGEEALDLMREKHFDVVFLDHKMPGMDGVETLNRAKEFSQGTKFIALTANSGGNARQEYINMGFDDYLPKPFKQVEMMKILREVL